VLVLLAACGGGSGATTNSPAETTAPTVAPADTTATETTMEAPETEETTTTFAPESDALVLYSGRNESFVEPVIEAFTAETGIEVATRYAGTGELATTIVAEGDAT